MPASAALARPLGGGDQPPMAGMFAQRATRLPPMADLGPLQGARAIDLLEGRARDWPAPDQGARNTCVAFALKACLELWRAGPHGAMLPLSAQFLYYAIRTNPPADVAARGLWNTGAVSLFDGVAALTRFGICPESDCPYVETPGASSAAGQSLEGPAPSSRAVASAMALRIAPWSLWDRENPALNDGKGAGVMLYEQLAAGRPAAITMPEFTAADGDHHWTTHNDSGIIRDPPLEGWDPSAHIAHAVCVIGYQPDDGDGWFIFRNSVGPSFGRERNPLGVPSVPARGYGALSARHVDAFGWRIASPGGVVP